MVFAEGRPTVLTLWTVIFPGTEPDFESLSDWIETRI
jgi:hypothetical protein